MVLTDTHADVQLVQAAQADTAAFSAIYDEYSARIFRYLQRESGDYHVAVDLLGATFEKALRNLHRYQPRGVPLSAWLYKIGRNELLMWQRKRKWTVPLFDTHYSAVNVEQLVQDAVAHAEVAATMRRLKPRDQEILRLHFYEELTHAEIAHMLACSTRNVAVRLHRALARLRALMGVNDGKS